MKKKVLSKILKIIVFNSEWGLKEGEEHKKLIFYSLNETENDSNNFDLKSASLQKIVKDIGLCEAIIKFSKNFGQDEEVSSVHGTKIRLVFSEVEKNYWICLSLSLPKNITQTTNLKDENSEKLIEYFDEDLNDNYVKLLIKLIYENFYLFKGSLANLWNSNQNLDIMRKQCGDFFYWFLTTIKINSINLIELFNAIIYIPLDNLTFLELQCFINHITACDNFCKYIMFLYNDQLIYSSLDLLNTKIIYRYIVSQIISEAFFEELNESFKSKTPRTRYMKTNINIFLANIDKDPKHLMNIYRSHNGCSVVLITQMEKDNTILTKYLEKYDAYMSPRLPDLTTKIADQTIKITSKDNIVHSSDTVIHDQLKFIYFNNNNSAYKSNLGGFFNFLDNQKILDSNFVKLILDIDSDLKTSLKSSCAPNIIEILAKNTNDCWLIVNECDNRTLFSFLNNKNANLIEAAETTQNYMSKKLKNILFID